MRKKDLSVALYGGSFDPPHIAHIAIVNALCNLNFLDKVIVMPTFLNPFKSNTTAPAELRLEWLRDIFEHSKNVEVSSYEVDLGVKTPTITTVNHLLDSYKKIYVVIGADNLKSLKMWSQFEELENKVKFIVATRDNIDIPSNFIQLPIDLKSSSTELRKKMNIQDLPEKNALKIMQYYKEQNAK